MPITQRWVFRTMRNGFITQASSRLTATPFVPPPIAETDFDAGYMILSNRFLFGAFSPVPNNVSSIEDSAILTNTYWME